MSFKETSLYSYQPINPLRRFGLGTKRDIVNWTIQSFNELTPLKLRLVPEPIIKFEYKGKIWIVSIDEIASSMKMEDRSSIDFFRCLTKQQIDDYVNFLESYYQMDDSQL